MGKYRLTEEAFRQLEEIEERSLENFSQADTEKYMAEIYKGFQRAADSPSQDHARAKRSDPFSMQPAGANHFAVYNRFGDDIIIGAIFGQSMNIENEIEETKARVAASIERVHEELDHSGRNISAEDDGRKQEQEERRRAMRGLIEKAVKDKDRERE